MTEKIVEVKEGLLSGTTDGKTAVLMGIPYAAPPVGELRWRAPKPAAHWDGVLDATKNPPMPVQVPMPNSLFERHPMSEDCLYLNIFAPDDNVGNHAVLV